MGTIGSGCPGPNPLRWEGAGRWGCRAFAVLFTIGAAWGPLGLRSRESLEGVHRSVPSLRLGGVLARKPFCRGAFLIAHRTRALFLLATLTKHLSFKDSD